MANTKTYSIKINGIQESIDAIESLNEKLFQLEQRIKTIESKSINIKGSASSGGGSTRTSNASALSEEEKLAKQIEQIDAKREAYSKEIYQNYLAAKDVLKETVTDQKAISAQERLQADAYSNTMMGMKQKLADIKAAMQTVDLGDTDTFKKMTQDANELNNKLKEIEESYGQFGRNVGNYADAAKNMQAIVVTINGVEREFGSAREATKTLNNELKAMAVQGKENTKEYEELRQKLLELESTMNDAKKPMDGILDTMESFTAIASVSKGLGAFFGVDQTEIQKSMQQLLALQTALKGLQSIAKQIETREGVGKWIAPFTANIDKATKKLLIYNRALLGTGKSAKIAAVGVKFFGNAVKMAISGGILIAVDLLIEGIMKLVEAFKTSKQEITDVKKVMEEGADAYAHAEATLSKYQYKIDNFNGTKKQEKKLVEELNSQLGDSIGHYKSIAEWQDALVKKGPAYLKLMRLQALYQAAINQYAAQYIKLATGQAGGQELIDNTAYLKKLAEGFLKEADELSKEYKIGDYSDHIKDNNKKNKDAVKEAEKELAQARISSMKEGLNKTITQLEEERKQRLAKLDKSTKNYKQYEKQINDLYDAKILKATQEWEKEMIKSNQEMWTKIKEDTLKNSKDIYNGMLNSVEVGDMKIAEAANKLFNQDIASYGIQGKNQLSGDVRRKLGIISTDETTEIIKDYKDLIDIQRDFYIAENDFKTVQIKNADELEAAENHLLQVRVETSEKLKKLEWKKAFMWDEEYEKARYNIVKTLDIEENRVSKLRETLNSEYEAVKTHYDYQKALLDNYNSELTKKYDTQEKIMQADEVKKMLLEEGYTKELRTIFNQRISAIDTYWAMRISNEKTYADVLYEQQKRILDREHELALSANVKHWDEMQEASSKAYDKEIDGILAQQDRKLISEETAKAFLLEADKKYQNKANEIYANYKTQEAIIDKNYNTNLEKLELEKNKKLQDINKEYYESQLQELRDFQTAVNNLASKQPVRNDWGITNFKETNKNNRQLLSSYEAMFNQIAKMRNEINQKFQKGLINKDVYDSSIRELDNFSADLGNKMDEVKQKLSVGDQIGEFISDIQQYVQALGQGLQQIMSAVWSAQDQEFDNESRQLDKMNEALQKAMDKNEEILQKHQQNVNDIEGELQTARGDRREHLIDQLNAEIEAERRAAAEKKKLEKEQEALEKKKEDLAWEREWAQYQRQLAQIWVSGALAAVNAYATKPFIPVGLAMGSLALGLTAAQYAIAKAHPPKRYANGGLLEGKSHAQGGIKAGGVELEGHEYVINKHTTMQNIDLLEYINSNRRKLNISDLIDFYQGDKPRKAVQGVKTRFADGGQIPTLRTDIEVSDRLITAFQDYSNRNVVVSVVDINKKQKDVKNVRVLAGLDE